MTFGSGGFTYDLSIVGNEHDAGRVRSALHVTSLARTYGDALLAQTIRRSEDFHRALDSEDRAPLALAKPTSAAADDLREVAKILLQRLNIVVPRGTLGAARG